MNRKKFIASTGLLGLSTTFSNVLFGKEKKVKNPMKEKIVLKEEGKRLNCLGYCPIMGFEYFLYPFIKARFAGFFFVFSWVCLFLLDFFHCQ